MDFVSVFDIQLANISRKEWQSYCKEKLSGNKFCHIATVNPEFFVYASRHPSFHKLLQKTALNICDGVGIVYMQKLLYDQSVSRIPGVAVAEMLCSVCAQEQKSVFFLGGFGVADKAAQYMKSLYPDLIIAGSCDGNEDTFDTVYQTQPDAILVALGSPKQEHWLSEKAPQIPSLRIGIGVGGTFDFWSGQVKRAPQWMQKAGLEWFFRLLTQPKRWIRIFRAVFVFPLLMIRKRYFSTNQHY